MIQGGMSSPQLHNNSVLESQKKVSKKFIYLSLLNYADNILNLGRTVAGIEILIFPCRQIL